jgi:hypothetical protein
MNGFAQNHILAEELETVVTLSLDIIIQAAVVDIVELAYLEQITQLANQLLHQV